MSTTPRPWATALLTAAAVTASGGVAAANHDFTAAGQTWSTASLDNSLGALVSPGSWDTFDAFSFSLLSGLSANVTLTVDTGAVGGSTSYSPSVATYNAGSPGSMTYALPSVSNTSGSTQTYVLFANGVGSGGIIYDTTTTQPQPTTYSFSITTAAVPEASTIAMLMAGLGVLGAVARRRRA